MKIRRDLFIVALAIFCLTAPLFMIKPTKSDLPPGQYNPWADVNNDGTVDIYDAIGLSNSFGLNDTGANSRNVNVTKNPAVTIQQDINISIHSTGGEQPTGWGESSTSIISTEGYDRMFVSFALVDISNSTSWANAQLDGINWRWGSVNSTSLSTFTSAYHARATDWENFTISTYNASYLPSSYWHNLEFTVEAAQCSVFLYASTQCTTGWILVRVSVYLTVGTASPPFVQNTYVTNMPSQQPAPDYTDNAHRMLTSINGYSGYNSTYVDVGGYSRMFLSIEVRNASYYGTSLKTYVTLTSISWDGAWNEPVPYTALNATYNGFAPTYSQQVPLEFKTKGSYCYLSFSISSDLAYGWLEFYVKVYLRNE